MYEQYDRDIFPFHLHRPNPVPEASVRRVVQVYNFWLGRQVKVHELNKGSKNIKLERWWISGETVKGVDIRRTAIGVGAIA